MYVAFSIEDGKDMGLPCWEPNNPEKLRYRKPHCSVKSTCQTRKVIPGRVSSFITSLENFIFFIRSEQTRWCTLRPNYCPISIPFPTTHRKDHVPLKLRWSLICSPASLKESTENCFATDLAEWNSSHHPVFWTRMLSLNVPSHWALSPDSAGEILDSLWTKLLKFCYFEILLLWGWGTLATPSGCESSLQSVGWQGANLLKFLSLPKAPFFGEVSVRSVRCTSGSLVGLKCSLLWCDLFGDQLRGRKTRSITVLILKIDVSFWNKEAFSPKKKKIVWK